MLKYLSTVVLVGILFSNCFAQDEEKSKQLNEFEITVGRLNRYYVDSVNVYLTRKDIEALQPDDLGELLRKLPGVNVKSYGGLGGLKTVSIRGLGGQHTNFVLDGFSQTQTQTGQVNLGQIQLDNIESIVVQRGGSSEILIPAAAQLSGNAIILESFQTISPTIPLQQKLTTKFGSFGQTEHYYIGKTGSQKVFGGIFLKYREAHGSYPYQFKNYQTYYSGIRKNNDYNDINGGFNLRYQINNNHQVNFYFQHLETKQGLPGAVVLYNDFAKQRLNTTNTQIKADYKGKINRINYRIHYNSMNDSLFYLDPTYLNSKGELRASYRNRTHDIGINSSLELNNKLKFNLGTQNIYSKLHSIESLTATPERNHLYTFFKTTYSFSRITSIVQLGHQYVNEQNKSGVKAQNINRFNPYLEIKYHLNEKITFISYYRNSFRMPNFNELYYNNIGNNQLKPEEANQISLSTSITTIDKPNLYIGFQTSAYYHSIKNMILTIPTKNLFVWSIQNIGKNEVRGIDFIGSFSWNINPIFSIQYTGNYTYQQSLDISNPQSPSYYHQVAYSPLHTFNNDLTFQIKNAGIRFSSFSCSERYALNQNINANRIDGFSIFDISIFNKFQLDKNNSIRLQLTIKNLNNNFYAFVKNYVMPGRQILFSFTYAFI